MLLTKNIGMPCSFLPREKQRSRHIQLARTRRKPSLASTGMKCYFARNMHVCKLAQSPDRRSL